MNGVFIVSQDGGHLLFHKVWGVCRKPHTGCSSADHRAPACTGHRHFAATSACQTPKVHALQSCCAYAVCGGLTWCTALQMCGPSSRVQTAAAATSTTSTWVP